MTKTERAIEHFEGMVRLAQNRHPHPDLEFWQAALDALRLQHEAEENEPLTLEEILQMDGQPVYVAWDGRRKDWALVHGFWKAKGAAYLTYSNGDSDLIEFLLKDGAKIYRHPPKEAHDD